MIDYAACVQRDSGQITGSIRYLDRLTKALLTNLRILNKSLHEV
jgi:hypothetical protein